MVDTAHVERCGDDGVSVLRPILKTIASIPDDDYVRDHKQRRDQRERKPACPGIRIERLTEESPRNERGNS